MMGSVDFLGGCPAGSPLKFAKIEHLARAMTNLFSGWWFYKGILCPNINFAQMGHLWVG